MYCLLYKILATSVASFLKRYLACCLVRFICGANAIVVDLSRPRARIIKKCCACRGKGGLDLTRLRRWWELDGYLNQI